MSDNGLILCVDDDTTVLMALRTLMEHSLGAGYVIEIAESGEEALEILEDLNRTNETIAVVVSDFLMHGMRGDELLIEIHRRSPRTVTIMLTGQSDFDGVKQAINQIICIVSSKNRSIMKIYCLPYDLPYKHFLMKLC